MRINSVYFMAKRENFISLYNYVAGSLSLPLCLRIGIKHDEKRVERTDRYVFNFSSIFYRLTN